MKIKVLRNGWAISVSADGCNYKEPDRKIKEQFINGINDEMKTTEIIKGVNHYEKTNGIMNEQVLTWTKRTETQRSTAM